MTDELATLASRLDAIVRAVPGVQALYSTTPAIVTSVRQITPGVSAPELVSVRAVGDAYEIVINIGVDSRVQGPRTAAAVSAAVLAGVPERMLASVHVRISRVLAG